MILKGQRVLLTLPHPPDLKVIVDEKLKEEMAQEYYDKCDKLEVFMVGDIVNDIKKGDVVYIPTKHLRSATLIEIKKEKYAMINVLDIAIIWGKDETTS